MILLRSLIVLVFAISIVSPGVSCPAPEGAEIGCTSGRCQRDQNQDEPAECNCIAENTNRGNLDDSPDVAGGAQAALLPIPLNPINLRSLEDSVHGVPRPCARTDIKSARLRLVLWQRFLI
jgi:hypothetical protein